MKIRVRYFQKVLSGGPLLPSLLTFTSRPAAAAFLRAVRKSPTWRPVKLTIKEIA